MRLRSIDFRLSDEQPDLKPEGKNMAISTVLTTYLNGLSDGEARQLVSHLKKHSFDGNILTAEGQAHLRDAEILIEQPKRVKSAAQLEREAALDVLIAAEREANETYAEVIGRLGAAKVPSVPGSDGGYGVVNSDTPAARDRYNREVAARNEILDEVAIAAEARQTAADAVREAARTLNQDEPLPARQRRRLPSIFKG